MRVITTPAPQGVLARADAFVQRLRDAIDARIRAVLPGDDGAIAAMLIDGKRDVIAPNVYDALFVCHRPRAVDLRLSCKMLPIASCMSVQERA